MVQPQQNMGNYNGMGYMAYFRLQSGVYKYVLTNTNTLVTLTNVSPTPISHIFPTIPQEFFSNIEVSSPTTYNINSMVKLLRQQDLNYKLTTETKPTKNFEGQLHPFQTESMYTTQ